MYGVKVYIKPEDILNKLSKKDQERFNDCIFTDVVKEQDGSVTIGCILSDTVQESECRYKLCDEGKIKLLDTKTGILTKDETVEEILGLDVKVKTNKGNEKIISFIDIEESAKDSCISVTHSAFGEYNWKIGVTINCKGASTNLFPLGG